MTPNGIRAAEYARVAAFGRYQLWLLSSGAMAPSTRDDTTARLETAKLETTTTELDTTGEADRRAPWHERPVVLVAASIVGVIGLIALAVSVVEMSDESAHPAHGPAATAVSATTTPAPEVPPTTSAAAANSAEPLVPSPSLPPTSVPDFAAGPTAEMKVPPTPSAPPPFRLPRWLLRMLHPRDETN